MQAPVIKHEGDLYITGAAAVVSGGFEDTRSPIILHNILCTGSEQRLFDCDSQIHAISSCRTAAGVTCLPGI